MKINKGNIGVLIIDDDQVSRLLLRHILKKEGYNVIGEADGGETGLNLTDQLKPDIVCLDIVMPDCNGIEILHRIKSRWPRTIVLMTSGNNDRETVLWAIKSGANGYIIKPFDASKLLSTVEASYAKAHGLAH
jgi:two-component system chemotaxis response regulator CheY